MVIIGLVGMPKSGKGAASEALVSAGWTQISMSTVLGDMILRDHPDMFHSREDLHREDYMAAAISYRQESRNPGILAVECLRIIDTLPAEKQKKVVIDGIRHPGEIEVIMQACPQSHMIGIVADDTSEERDFETRWHRFFHNKGQRGRHFEPHSKKKFRDQDAMEWDNPYSEYGSKIGACLLRVSMMQEAGEGKILVNGEAENVLQWGERIVEYSRRFEGQPCGPEQGN